MGRKKAKKSKSNHGSGHKRHGSHSQSGGSEASNSAQAVDPAVADPPAPVGCLSRAADLVKEEAKVGEAMAQREADPPLASARDRQSPSPPRQINKNTNTRLKPKGARRNQVQGHLNGLEAELAVVEDLQARMAAKLSALDVNMAENEATIDQDQPDEQARQENNTTPDKNEPVRAEEKPPSTKKKNKKKSKQDKAHKQEENMKEAQQMRESILSLGEAGHEGRKVEMACCPHSEVPVRDSPERMLDCFKPSQIKLIDLNETKPPKCLMMENQMKDAEREKESKKLIVEIDVIDVIQPSCELEKDKIDDVNNYVKSNDVAAQERKAEMTREVAQYLKQECDRMLSVHAAIHEEMELLPQMLNSLMSSHMDSGTQTTQSLPSSNLGHFFSYADAVKSSLKTTLDDDCDGEGEDTEKEKSAFEKTEVENGKEQQTYLFKYMKSEYEPCLRKLEAEEAEIFYQEAMEKKKKEEGSGEIPRIEISSVSETTSQLEQKAASQQSRCNEKEGWEAVLAAMTADCEQMQALKRCTEAEFLHREIVEKDRFNQSLAGMAKNKSSGLQRQSKEGTRRPNDDLQIQATLEVARYLKDESARLESLRAAERGEEFYQEKLQWGEEKQEGVVEEGGSTDASRMTAMLEAATMEVEYDKVEQEYLLQREQQRQQPWRWVRADTAPAYINVPETVPEPTSDQEEEADVQQSTTVQTDLAGLVFQCRDSCTQTEGQYVECCKCGQMALPWDQQFALRLQEEVAQRRTLENMVRLLEAEAADQRQRLFQQRKFADELENSITDKKAEATEAKILAMEYKSRCQDLEHSLDTARSVVNTLEEHADTYQPPTSGLDYMLEAKINALKAKESQGKVNELEAKLALSKSEVQTLLDNLSDQNRHEDLMPVLVHQQQLDQVETRCYQLQLKVTQLEAELAKVQNVRDVWGSNQQGPSTVQGGGLDMAFQSLGTSHQAVYTLPPSVLSKTSTSSVDLPPITNVDLPPVPGLHGGGGPGCLSGLHGLGSTPSGEGPGLATTLGDLGGPAALDCGTLSSGLLSGLSDLQAKSTAPVVAPLAMQEDMDSDDDVSWSSASEHLKDIGHSSGQSRPTRPRNPKRTRKGIEAKNIPSRNADDVTIRNGPQQSRKLFLFEEKS